MRLTESFRQVDHNDFKFNLFILSATDDILCYKINMHNIRKTCPFLEDTTNETFLNKTEFINFEIIKSSKITELDKINQTRIIIDNTGYPLNNDNDSSLLVKVDFTLVTETIYDLNVDDDFYNQHLQVHTCQY